MTDKIIDTILEYIENKDISVSRFERMAGLSNGYLAKIKNRETDISSKMAQKILITMPELSSILRMSKTDDFINSKKNQTFENAKNELNPIEFTSHIEVKVVTTKARAGYSESYYSEEYLDDMPTVLIEADKEYHGKYLAFEVDGDSMEPDYHPGDIVICREIKRDLWRYKLHYEDWDFVIAHGTNGIMLKQITDHNVETGEIVCHSVNQEGHPDFTLDLREIAFLYNVVEHRISGKNKRRYR